jgi:hypothetical protein
VQVGQVGDPQPIGRLDGELALHEVRAAVGVGVGPGRLPRSATALGPDDPMRAHEPLHRAARRGLAGSEQRLPHPPVAVGVVVGRVQLTDPPEQPLVLHGSRRAPAAGPLVVRGRRHGQDSADRLDAEAAAVLVDEAAHVGRSASSSVAKNTDAALRISFARRSS